MTAGLGQSGRWCPVEEASWWSQLTYSFCSSLIKIGYRKPLQLDNLWDVPHHLSAPACCNELAEHLAASYDPVKAPQVLPSAPARTLLYLLICSGAESLLSATPMP